MLSFPVHFVTTMWRHTHLRDTRSSVSHAFTTIYGNCTRKTRHRVCQTNIDIRRRRCARITTAWAKRVDHRPHHSEEYQPGKREYPLRHRDHADIRLQQTADHTRQHNQDPALSRGPAQVRREDGGGRSDRYKTFKHTNLRTPFGFIRDCTTPGQLSEQVHPGNCYR